MEREADLLLSHLLEDLALPEDRAAALVRALDTPDTAGEVEAEFQTEMLLREVLAREGSLDRSRQRLLARAVLREKSRALRRARRLRLRVTGWAAAALAVVAAGSAWLWQVRSQRWERIEARGDVAVIPIAGGPEAPRAPQRGDRLVAGPGGARLRLGGYCELALDGGTEVVVRGEARKEVVQIALGRLVSKVRPGRGTYMVLTPAGTLEVKGTEFVTTVSYEDRKGTDMKARTAIVTVLVLAGVVGFDVGGERGLISVGGSRVFAAEVAQERTIPAGLVPAQPPNTETSPWEGNGPKDGNIHALAVDPATPTTLYAGTEGSGVLKSTDGGWNWTAINTGLAGTSVYALAVDPTTPTTLYAGTWHGHGVFKSTNGGENWRAVNAGLTGTYVNALAIDPKTPTTLYAGTWHGHGVFKSTNGGENWSAVNAGLTGTYVNALTIDPTTPTTLYAGTWHGHGVFKSTDGGENWSAVNAGLTGTYVNDLAIDPKTSTTLYAGTWYGHGVFRSTDGGGNWSAVKAGMADSYVYALAIDPATPTTLYAGTQGSGVFRSTDSGGKWRDMNTGLPELCVRVLVTARTMPTLIYAGTCGDGVFASQ
jgi:photosystem II stability/assembly factor-like uncharacterized protein